MKGGDKSATYEPRQRAVGAPNAPAGRVHRPKGDFSGA